MMKRFVVVPFVLIAGLFLMTAYSFGGQMSPDSQQYYAQEDSGSCCCKISNGETDEPGTYTYQSASVDDCTAAGGSCVADNFCG